ncbi:MAG TPA: hypothetical protein DDZ89_11355 [Clostridiales bacterium]|nr:hypothetical protein [Clostridiales bacterium]
MKRNIFISILIIAISASLIAGATMAWFTDATEPIENTFTAGTVEISANETKFPTPAMAENWNPGDEAEKEFTIINTGTKGIYLRATITGQWYNKDGSIFVPNPTDKTVVTWTFYGDGAAWTKDTLNDNTWYYNDPIAGTYSGATQEARTVKLNIKVKLAGAETDNQYQGKVFKLSTTFESIQSSNGAVDTWTGNPYPVVAQ